MAATQVVPGVYRISLGYVNAFLLVADDLTLIDTGFPGDGETILEAVKSLGRRPEEIKRVLVTHCHSDHAGGLATIRRATGAPAYMHPADAVIVKEGRPQRPLLPAPGLVTGVMFRLFIRAAPPLEGTDVEGLVLDGEELPAAGGVRAIHVPGHCAGQLAFLWPPNGGVLFAADAASNVMGLGLSLGYEDLEEGRSSLAKLASLQFEVACFGHGKPIGRGASERFRRKWSPSAPLKEVGDRGELRAR